MGRKCLFCDEPANSKEHVLPEWLNDVVPATGPFTIGWGQRRWEAAKINHTMRLVCEQCNTGWMCELEGRAKPILAPMIQGLDVTLSAADQAVVSLWAAKTFGIIEATHPHDESLYTKDDYRRIYTRQLPPRRQHIWIAGLHAWEEHQSLFLRNFATRDPNITSFDAPDDDRPPIAERRRNYSLVLSIYHLVFHLMTIRMPPGVSPVVMHHQDQQGFVEQIHPTRHDAVSFPPKHIVPNQAQLRIIATQPAQVVPLDELDRLRNAADRKRAPDRG